MSPEEIAASIGLDGYACEGAGIGGLLKCRYEDFRVDEVATPPGLDPKGRFTVVRVTLTNWETNRFIQRLAKELRISKKRIWFSGTKDKRAVTSQYLVVDAKEGKFADVDIKDVEIEIIGRTHQKLGLGAHDGNRFTITVRGCADSDGSPLDAKEALARVNHFFEGMIEKLGPDCFPNWIGPQRFGATRPVTSVVGRAVVEGDFEAAVQAYLGMAGIHQHEDVDAFRTHWRENQDVAGAMEICPKNLGFEYQMLKALESKPGDWVHSFRSLPQSLQLMMVHSLQSVAFNHILAARLNAGLSLVEPVVGDRVGPYSDKGKIDLGKEVVVEESTQPRLARNCKLGRLAITALLPGGSAARAEQQPGEIETAIIEKLGMADYDWQISAIPRLSSKGSRRPMAAMFTDFSVEEAPELPADSLGGRFNEGPREGELWHPEGASLRLRFVLPSGTYATILLREFMRGALTQY